MSNEVKEDKVYEGTVIFFSNKLNYGFVTYQIDGVLQKDMFCHHTDISGMSGFRTLQKDAKVSFKIGFNKHGDPKAIDVKVIG